MGTKRKRVHAIATDNNGSVAVGESSMEKEAGALLRQAVVTYCGLPVGTIAANDPTDTFPLDYDQFGTSFLEFSDCSLAQGGVRHCLQLHYLYASTAGMTIATPSHAVFRFFSLKQL